jgi:hypothetical protein
LQQPDAEALLAAVRVLRDEGPSLGRPLVDRVHGSRYPNMKELRPGSAGRTEIRVLFAFDKARKAILLVGGDKNEDWNRWYKENTLVADARFAAHQARVEGAQATKTGTRRKTRKTKLRRRR